MADAVTTKQLAHGPRKYVTQLTNISDGTGETNVVKIDISAFVDARGRTATYMAIDKIQYQVSGFDGVKLAFDATADETIAVLLGQGELCFPQGLVDARGAGTTGDLLLSTLGTAAANDSYDIIIHWRPKA